MPIKPIGSFLLVQPEEVTPDRETTTKSGIVLPGQKEERLDLAVSRALVLDVGSDVKQFKKGQIVLYNFFSGNQYIIPGKDPQGEDDITYHLVYESDILALIED